MVDIVQMNNKSIKEFILKKNVLTRDVLLFANIFQKKRIKLLRRKRFKYWFFNCNSNSFG